MLLEEIEVCLGSRPRALLLQECFMTKAEMLALKISGYRPVAATEGVKSKNKLQRRGSVILVDLFLNIQPLKERTVEGIELIGVKVAGDTTKTFEKPFELWTVYSGPYKEEAIECKKMLTSLCKQRKSRVLLAGDLNSDISPGGSQTRKVIRLELERMEEKGQATILNEYRAITTNNGSVIDLAVTMGDWDVGFAQPIDWHLGSTHYPICIGVSTGESKARKLDYENIPRYIRNNESAAKLKRKLAAIRSEVQQHTGETLSQAIFDAFKETSLDPTPKKIRKQQKHWVNDEIKALFAEKQKHLTTSGKNSSEFKEVDEKLQNAISKAKNESFQEFASGLNHCNQNSNVYRVMRSIGSKRPSRIAELAVLGKDGEVVTDMKKKVNLLSRRYQVPLGYHPKKDLTRRKVLKQNRVKNEEENPRGTDHLPFTAAEVRIARDDMSNNKAPGLSRIRKEDLEMGGEEMDALIGGLADKIATSGEWPKVQKKGVICPFPKEYDAVGVISEDKTRPIALLEAHDKWIQRMFYNRIIKHVEYDETQAGYCLSTDHHTTLVTDFVMNRKDDAYCSAVFTDISKAFDSVPFDELVEVIWASPIHVVNKWVLVSFIEDRQFRVEIRDANGNVSASKWRKMLYGTPQGSVLGPLLWNMFFDPLLKKLAKAKVESDKKTAAENKLTGGKQVVLDNLDTAFADDLTLLAAAEDPERAEQLLEHKLKIFKNFLEERGMEAASHKLKIMCLDPKKRGYSPQVHFDGKLIEEVEVHKFLGIFYDKHMTFTDHWKMVVASIASRTKTLAMLRGVSWGPTQQTARVLHRSYIESRIRFGMLAWYPFLKPWQKNQLEVYLRRSIRIVMGLPIHTRNQALMAESDLDSVAEMALKCAVSFYVRINPTDESQTTLVKKHYKMKEPRWAALLKQVPQCIWDGPIQTKLSKKIILAADSVSVRGKTIDTQEEAEIAEREFTRILYTDASVVISTDPPGKAAIGYIWYKKSITGTWEEVKRGSATIGTGHSSYSAEAIAIEQGLKKVPEASNHVEAPQEEEPVGVFTDSLSNLATIKKGVAETSEQEQLLRSIAGFPNNIVFHHVKAHQNNKKNNEVDALCNVNANTTDRVNLNHLGGKKTASKIKNWMNDWTRNRRMKNAISTRTKESRKSVTREWMQRFLIDENKHITPPPKVHNQLPRKKGVLLAKARTNRWTQCNWYLNFIKQRESPKCSTCNVSDTTEHVVDKCSLHEGPRTLLLKKLQHYGGRVSDLLSSRNKQIANAVAEFLVEIEEIRKTIWKKEEKEREEKENKKTMEVVPGPRALPAKSKKKSNWRKRNGKAEELARVKSRHVVGLTDRERSPSRAAGKKLNREYSPSDQLITKDGELDDYSS